MEEYLRKQSDKTRTQSAQRIKTEIRIRVHTHQLHTYYANDHVDWRILRVHHTVFPHPVLKFGELGKSALVRYTVTN